MNNHENNSDAIKCPKCGSTETTGPKGTWKCTECGSKSYVHVEDIEDIVGNYLSSLVGKYIFDPIVTIFFIILQAFILVILIPFKIFIYPFRLLWESLKRMLGRDSKKNKELKAEGK